MKKEPNAPELSPVTVKDYAVWAAARPRCESGTALAALTDPNAPRAETDAVLRVLAIGLQMPVIGGCYPIGRTEEGVRTFLHRDARGRWLPGGRLYTEAELAAHIDAAAAANAANQLLDLAAAVAMRAGCRPRAVLAWPVNEFNAAVSAVTRFESWRRAPVPGKSWLLAPPRPEGLPAGCVSLTELDRRAVGLLRAE